MFEYVVYAMDYEDAITHLSFLKSLPKKNLRIFAHLHGMSIEQFESKINSMLKETSSSFAERRLKAVRNGRKSAYPRICRSSPLFVHVGTQAGEYRI